MQKHLRINFFNQRFTLLSIAHSLNFLSYNCRKLFKHGQNKGTRIKVGTSHKNNPCQERKSTLEVLCV